MLLCDITDVKLGVFFFLVCRVRFGHPEHRNTEIMSLVYLFIY